MTQNDIKDWRAKKKWYALPRDLRKKIESNVWCATCRSISTMKDYVIKHREPAFVLLRGKCKTCGGEVCRVVESEK